MQKEHPNHQEVELLECYKAQNPSPQMQSDRKEIQLLRQKGKEKLDGKIHSLISEKKSGSMKNETIILTMIKRYRSMKITPGNFRIRNCCEYTDAELFGAGISKFSAESLVPPLFGNIGP